MSVPKLMEGMNLYALIENLQEFNEPMTDDAYVQIYVKDGDEEHRFKVTGVSSSKVGAGDPDGTNSIWFHSVTTIHAEKK